MPVGNRNTRGIQDIRTHSGRVHRSLPSYMAFMKVTALEMEKVRKLEERKSALCRVQIVDARIAEIEKEKAELLAAQGIPTEPARSGGKSAASSRPPSSGAEGFQFNY